MRLMAPLRFGGHWNGFEKYDLVFYRFIFTYLISSSKGLNRKKAKGKLQVGK